MGITTILYRAAVTIAAVAISTLVGAGLASAAVSHPAAPRPCYFDGGGAITSGATARTDTGLWTCYDGHLVHVAARTLPSWAHWKTAPRGACRQGAGIIIWAGHGDGVLVCSNGDTETS